MDARLQLAERAAIEAAEIVRGLAGRVVERKQKSSGVDLLTEADTAAEVHLVSRISHQFPEDVIVAEETSADLAAVFRTAWDTAVLWLVDPLDGTTNFAHGYPQVAISIAAYEKGRPRFGLIYDLFRQELFKAMVGGGAQLNGSSIRVSRRRSLAESLVATGFPYDRREHVDRLLDAYKQAILASHGVRRGGAAALDLCYVACGRLDGFWEEGLKPWDIGAGAILVREAGGTVSDYEGGPFDVWGNTIVATNGLIHDEMISCITRGRGRD